MMKSKELFLLQQRFDLMFKYLYVKYQEKYGEKTDFFKKLYLEHVRIFNNFYEREPVKNTPFDFLNNFDKLISEIHTNGFNANYPIPVNKENQIINGAHRLSVCFAKNLDVEISKENKKFDSKAYNYDYFRKRHINSIYADYVALEYVNLNPNAYIVNLQPVASPEFDYKVENILNKYGFIYYKKNIFLSYNGLVNLKKLFYGKEKWIGNLQNDFRGARKHAKASSGAYPLRAYVFVCDNLKNVRKAKEEIRNIYKIGNNSVHINDTQEEAIEIAQTYFNDNSLFMLNNRPYNFEDKLFDQMLTKLPPNVCLAGSTPLNVFGLRKSNDLDFLSLVPTGNKDEHIGKWEKFYPYNKYEIILNPKNYFYYKGRKIVTLEITKLMKINRNEAKDLKDIKLIDNFIENSLDYSSIQNTNFEIYQDVLQKLITSIRAEVLFKTSLRRRIINLFFPNRSLFRMYKYKILSKICSGKKKKHYLDKLERMN